MSEANNTTGAIPIDTNYAVSRTRRHESGLLVIPVAGPPGTPPEIVRVHGGLELVQVDFSADRLSAPPVIPHPELDDQNSVLLGGGQVVTLPMIQPQGNHEWNISGSYTYVSQQQVGLSAPIPTGVMPFDAGTSNQNTIPASNFSQGIVEGDASVPKIQPPTYAPKL